MTAEDDGETGETMPNDAAMSTAARELGLAPGAMELAAQLGEVRTVRTDRSGGSGGAGGSRRAGSVDADAAEAAGRAPRRVPHSEIDRLRAAEDFPDGLRARLQAVDAGGGARLLGVTSSRFARLARGGCFSPVSFYVNRYRTVVWLYLAAELREFGGRRPELLSGRLPRGLRILLAEGVDLRAGHWRGRRLGQLCRQAEGPWEAAAARAAVLAGDVLEEAVPDAAERARLRALRPELAPLRGRSTVVRELTRKVCTAAAEDEIFWQRLLLDADLESAREADRRTVTAADATSAASPDRHAGPASPAGSTGRAGASRPVGRAAVAREPDGCPAGTARGTRPVRPVGRAGHAVHARPREDGPPSRSDEETAAVLGRARALAGRARVLRRLRAPRPRPAWWGREMRRERATGLSRPAF